MTAIVQFKAADRAFDAFGDDAAKASISRLVGPEISTSMGAGVARFDGCSISWTVLYDEVIVTLEGRFSLRVGETVYDCAPGDVLWIPANTALHYEGMGATVFYALSPVDWRAKAGI